MSLPPISQPGRASLEFLGSLAQFSGSTLLKRAERSFEAAHGSGARTDGPLRERLQAASDTLSGCKEYALDRLITRYIAEKKEERGLLALEPIRDQVEELLQERSGEGGTLELNPDLQAPRYYRETEFHLTPGGWNGDPLMGALLHELVYPYVLTGGVGAVKTGENLYDQRYQAATQARKRSYERILELGVGTGQYAAALQRAFPDARIAGVDLAAPLLRWAHYLAAERGYTWELKQAAAEETGYPDDSFDLVTCYILLHEVPPTAARAIAREAFRVTKPGGDVLLADVAPYSQQTDFRALVLDWETENRNEPFWREALLTDRAALLREAGFVEVEEFGVDGNYPWITRGVKPARL